MIFGDLKHWKQEEGAFSPPIRYAMERLQQLDFGNLLPGKYEIDGDRIFYIVSESITQDRQGLKAESHQSYMDIQYIVEGEEKIGFARLTDEQSATDDLLESSDALLYESLHNEMELLLQAGNYVMFYPADIHRPGCKVKEAAPLKKIVFKIKLDEGHIDKRSDSV